MEIILKEDVIGLGYKHDIVNVKPGYGRNYLIPQGKGVIASESAKKQLAEELKQKAKKLEKIKADAQAIADKLEGVAVTVVVKVSSNGTIYGSVNSVQIADELSKLGFDIDRKLISIKESLSPSFPMLPSPKSLLPPWKHPWHSPLMRLQRTLPMRLRSSRPSTKHPSLKHKLQQSYQLEAATPTEPRLLVACSFHIFITI